ncbi:hypothetical protein AX761_21715 [Rhizobium sp. 58]|nr:hypothetical protein AX761_21715 [Rhizobium sp. 58]
MVTVPVYQRDVALRPNLRQDVNVQATPQAFGSAVGAGMEQLGQGVAGMAAAHDQVKQLEDVASAKEADNQLSDWSRNRMYGDGGFMTLEGRNAIDGRVSFENELEAKRKEFGKNLTPGAAQAYQSASQARSQSILQQSIVKTAQERKNWFKDASDARAQTFANDALVSYGKPALVNKNIAAGVMEIRELGALQGWDADTLKVREGEFASGVHKNIALRIAQDDPIAANDYVKKNADMMTGAHQYEMKNALEASLVEAQSIRETEAILSGGRKVAELPGDIVGEVAAAAGGGGPTRAKAFLSSRSANAGREGDTLNLDDAFADNLAALIDDAPPGIREKLGLGSAYRSNERQKQLFANSDKTGHSVAFPAGHVKPDGSIARGSNHLHGRAVDLTYDGQRLDKAPKEVRDWVHSNARQYGMFFPMGHEPWHIEPTRGEGGSTVAARGNNVAPRSVMPSYADIEARLDAISDPKVRDMTRRRLYAGIEAQSRQAEANEKMAKAELWKFTDQGVTPDQVPLEIRQAAGMTAVASAWEYIEKTAKRGEVVTDDVLLYDMRKYAATNPTDFANYDLNDYRDRLGKDAIKELTALQTGALTDQRKAREDGLELTTAFAQAGNQLEAVGITTTGLKDSAREEASKRIAQFQNSLATQMEDFKEANKKKPNQVEIQSMINRLLLPVVIKEPGTLWGTNETPARLFEAGNRSDTATVDVVVEYSDIPIDLRRGIKLDLARELGREPSEEEVIKRYEDVALSQ